jgi:hypothetical protein
MTRTMSFQREIWFLPWQPLSKTTRTQLILVVLDPSSCLRYVYNMQLRDRESCCSRTN